MTTPEPFINNLPGEILVLIATEYLKCKIDQLNFIISHPKYHGIVKDLASSSWKAVFCNEFKVEDLEDYGLLVTISEALVRLHGNKGFEVNLKQRYFYSLDRRKGYLDSRQLRRSIVDDQERIRRQIVDSTFAVDRNTHAFVLIHSLNGNQFSSVSTCRTDGQSNHFHLPFEVMGQDLLLHQNLLFIMPLQGRKSKNQGLILLVFDIDSGSQVGSQNWAAEARKAPLVFKECGEKRLYAYKNTLLQILPLATFWTILIYNFHQEDAEFQLELVKSCELSWADPYVIGQLFSADQQGPNVVLAFFADKQGVSSYSGKLVTFNLSLDTDSITPHVMIPEMVGTVRFDLDLPVNQIQLVLAATSEYNIQVYDDSMHKEHQGSCCSCRKSFTHYTSKSASAVVPLVVILFPDGKLKTNCGAEEHKPLKDFEIDPLYWHHNELIVKDKRVLVMHKLPAVGRLVYATNLHLDLLWKLPLDSHFPLLSQMQNQRLYLYASHGLVWLSSAHGCFLLDQENGREFSYISYPKYNRILPELESLDENTSPYAQTGFSIWDMSVVKNQILITHDIERCAPVVHDWIKF